MRYFTVLLLAFCAATLDADDIGVASGNKAWLLLSEPLGPGPDKDNPLHPNAGDPGFPAPNWGGATGYTPTDLWCFDAEQAKYTRVTQVVTNKANLDLPRSRRTLYAPFLVNGEPYVIHFDGSMLHDGNSTCQVLKASAARLNEGKQPLLEGVVLASREYLDSPAVSPDGTRVVFRAFSGKGCVLRVFTTADWKQAAESEVRGWGRPVWTGPNTLCAVAYEALVPRVAEEDPRPVAGKLTRIELGETVALTTLLEGAFPPDTYTRCIAFDAARNKLVVARVAPRMKEGVEAGNEIVVEERDYEGAVREIARMDHFRGIVIDKGEVYVAGVRDRAVDDEKKSDRRLIIAVLRPMVTTPESDPKDEVAVVTHHEMSPDGRGGMQDLGDGIGAFLEPVLNPLAGTPGQLPVLHTFTILNWMLGAGSVRERLLLAHSRAPLCDTLRNPRAVQYLSAMARRFKEIDEFEFQYGAKTYRPRITNTFLGFDLDIKITDKAIKNKQGRYIELFENSGRKGAGRIRVEDNIGGNWMIYGLSGEGAEANDWVYDNTNAPNDKLNPVAAARAGMYAKLLGQMDSRKLLMLVGLELAPEKGGITYHGRETWRDPITGLTRRIWLFKRKGAGKDAATMGFVADMPYRSADMPNAHALLVAAVALNIAGGGMQSSILAFDSSYVELPDLSPYKDKGSPPMLLPKVVRAYARNDKGELEHQFSATLLSGEFDHPTVTGGKARCGYNVWGGKVDENFTETMLRIKTR